MSARGNILDIYLRQFSYDELVFLRDSFQNKFIVLEGVNGVGKDFYASKIMYILEKLGVKANFRNIPNKFSLLGTMSRECLSNFVADNIYKKIYQETLVRAALLQDLYQGDDSIVNLLTKKKRTVIATRYYMSSLVYSGINYPDEEQNALERYMYSFQDYLHPVDAYLYLDRDLDSIRHNMKKRGVKEVNEINTKRLQKRYETFIEQMFLNKTVQHTLHKTGYDLSESEKTQYTFADLKSIMLKLGNQLSSKCQSVP